MTLFLGQENLIIMQLILAINQHFFQKIFALNSIKNE